VTETIVPPRVTDALVLYLNDAYQAIDLTVLDLDELADGERLAHGRVPNPRPERFVTAERAGGFTTDRVLFTATVLFEAWGPTEQAASDLADLTYGLVHAIPGQHHGVTFYGVTDIAGPGQVPDPVSEQPRFVFTLSVRARATAI